MVSWPLSSAATWFQNIFQNAAIIQANVTDPLNDLNTRVGPVAPANPPLAKMRNAGAQSIVNGTQTALTWDTEDIDTVGGHSTSSNTSRYTCQAGYAGKYRAHVVVYWASNSTGVREAWLRVNGTDVPGSIGRQNAGAGAMSCDAETIVTLAVGDYVEAFCQQTSGGALSTGTAANTYLQSWFEVQWISS